MDMQDKEFDALFREKLDDVRIEPSTGLWKGIAIQLDAGKRKNRIVPFLSVAASIVVLITAGVVFVPRITTTIQKPVRNGITKIVQPIQKTTATIAKAPNQPMASNTGNTRVTYRTVKTSATAPVKKTPVIQTVTIVNPGTEQVKQSAQPVLAAVAQKQPDVITKTIPDEGADLSIKQPAEDKTIGDAKPLLAASTSPEPAKPVKAKRKGRTLGDFFNAVIAQVDKRRDKFIEFSDTDDDESSITGVNIGILKIKTAK